MMHNSRLVTERPIYHGFEDVIPMGGRTRPTLSGVLGLVDQAADLGADYSKLAPVRKGRATAERVATLRTSYAKVASDAADQMSALGADFAAGNLEPADVVQRATAAAVLTGTLATEARRHVDNAGRAAETTAVDLLRTVTEEQWINPLRPLVAALVEEANEIADAIGHDNPHAARRNVRSSQHPWAPADKELNQDLTLRHRWEKLLEVLGRLDAVHAIVTQLRRFELIPVAKGRDFCEDYRWLHLDLLAGNPGQQREFWLANRHADAKPGIYTSAELDEGTTARARQLGHDGFIPESVSA